MRKLRRNPFGETPRMRRRRHTLLTLVGTLTMVALALVGAVVFVLPRMETHAAAAAPNPNCTLIVPDQPLTANGLATPYKLTATDGANGPCNEANANQSAFVQGVIYDPTSGQFSVYNPLVIDRGTQPAVMPTVPNLPAGAIVGIWFGFNGTDLTLRGAQGDSLANANCVNGLDQSVFGQFAYCNAHTFFAAANQGIVAHRVHVPALQTARDGKPCLTVRDFGLVDQDQSDNVQTQYLATANGQTAQFSAANQAQLQNATTIANPSDNALLTRFVDPALGCQPWQAPSLTDNNTPVSALPLDEIQASFDQNAPIALVPLTDPMTLVANGNNNTQSRTKTNLYRQGTDQILAVNDQQASGTTYCVNLLKTGMPRLQLDKPLTIVATTPDAAMANSLFTFLAMRFQTSYNMLNCPQLLNIPNPVTTQTNNNGVVISATFNMQATTMPMPVPAVGPDCNINGTVLAGCTGTTTINGVTCSFAYDVNNHLVNINCPAKQ
ncbi:MAG TPA: hypothetical protein VNE38_05085 [Ktedonobacteraceae bacterium]|nr:hypothetical protein [Ktedonobacteraceae bacterium]